MSATGLDLDPMVTSVYDLIDSPDALNVAEDRAHNVKVQMTAG